MRSTSTLVSAALVAGVSAHTRIYSAWVNGEDQGDGRTTYIRSPPSNSPVMDVTASDIVCNVAGATPASGFVSAAAGDTISMEWYHDNRGDDIIASSHKGPIITWIAPYFEDAGAAPIWTKIHEAGYDAAAKTWAVDDLIANAGKADFTLPADLAPGQYVVRQEIIALHESDTCFATAGSRGAQFYPSCVQFEVAGSGTGVLPAPAFDFTAEYSCDLPGIEFNLYGSFTEYVVPGPDVETTLGSGGGSSTGDADPVTSAPAATAAPTPVTSAPAASTTTTEAGAPVETTVSSCKRRKARNAARAARRA